KVIVTIDGVEKEFFTTKEVVADFLQDEGLSFSEHDDLSFHVEDEVVDGLSLHVTTAFEVTINDAGEKQSVWTTGGSIADLLDQHDITLEKKLDKVQPALDEELDKDTTISITRVEIETDTIEENIDFKTETREDDTLEKGKEKVI